MRVQARFLKGLKERGPSICVAFVFPKSHGHNVLPSPLLPLHPRGLAVTGVKSKKLDLRCEVKGQPACWTKRVELGVWNWNLKLGV